MKNLFKGFAAIALVLLTLTGCGSSKSSNLKLSPQEVIDKIYEDIKSEMPMLMKIDIDKNNVDSYLGTNKVDFKEAVASEPMISSIAYSVVVVKLNEGADIEASKKLIKNNVNPRKWGCVDAEIVEVDNIGDTIILIMMDELNEELANEIQNNFNKLK